MKKVDDKQSFSDKSEIKKLILQKEFIGIKILNVENLEEGDHYIFGKSKLMEGEFKVNGDEGMLNLCIILAILANQEDKAKMYFSKLIIRADKEDQAAVVKFTSKSAEAFIEAYFAGCFRVLNNLQISQFTFDSKEALKIVSFFKDNPTLETLNLANNQLSCKIIKAVIAKIYDNEAIKIINISSNFVYSEDQLEIQGKYNYHKDKILIFA
mmetsp:Transcript_15444/g.17146  ORF Transcript_15444/g.17146 Transcript_15444/m.17146 type:complete len:211 (-) Transcript_15444:17-649(-)